MQLTVKPKDAENLLVKYGYAKPQSGLTRADMVRRGIPLAETVSELGGFDGISKEILDTVEIDAKYAGYLEKGLEQIEKAKKLGIKGIESVSGAEMTDDTGILTFQTIYGEKTCAYADAMLERCHVCKGKDHMVYDELIGESKDTKDAERFAEVEKIEAMSPEEKFAFFQKELSKCIRCNACRNVCPACSCRKCVFDSTKFDSAQKANTDSFEEKMFHIIRAFHVAGRCTDCGECSRVCPQGIPLHLFNRKFIKDINELYGEYQAGADTESRGPLTNFTFDDAEPSIVTTR
jgi:ferredoxin